MKYAFILKVSDRYPVKRLCKTLNVSRSGYDAWVVRAPSIRSIENERLLNLIRQSYEASGRTYGAPRILCDLRELGERCGKNRIAHLMKRYKIRAQRGYKKPGYKYTKPALAVPNRLNQEFDIKKPNLVWATDITYIRIYQG